MYAHIRSLIAVVGEKAQDQVVIIHHMLSKASVKARPSGMYLLGQWTIICFSLK